MAKQDITEAHPFPPFLPKDAKLLMLGTFPAKPVRWSMDFYYPNFINDMWRIMGEIFYCDKKRFESLSVSEKAKGRFDKLAIMDFCASKGIALSDTAEEISRLKGNASDQFLKIVKSKDIASLLDVLPDCRAIAATGTKASSVLSEKYGSGLPEIGGKLPITIGDRTLSFFRMPSTSRAYPLSFEKKADYYRNMFLEAGLLP